MALTQVQPQMAAGGPAFSVNRNNVNQTGVAASTWTKVLFTTKEFDTANCFDTSSNSRFTPNVAGYYQVVASAWLGGQASQRTSIYKNGSGYKEGNVTASAGGYMNSSSAVCLVYMNGTTDYLEVFVYQTSTTATIDGSTNDTYFQGVLVRAA